MLASVMIIPVMAIAQTISCWQTPSNGLKGLGCLTGYVACTPSSGGAWDANACLDPNGADGGPTYCEYNLTEKRTCRAAANGLLGCKPVTEKLTQHCWTVRAGQTGCDGSRMGWVDLGVETLGYIHRDQARKCRRKQYLCYVPS
jgi:hypothetical protein